MADPDYTPPANHEELKTKWQDPDHPNEPFKGFYQLCEMNGYYYEDWGTVCKVEINLKNMAKVTRKGWNHPRYFTLPELRSFLSREGYQKAAEL